MARTDPKAGETTTTSPWSDALHDNQDADEIPGHPGIDPADDGLDLF